jgi:hypothetical protein
MNKDGEKLPGGCSSTRWTTRVGRRTILKLDEEFCDDEAVAKNNVNASLFDKCKRVWVED